MTTKQTPAHAADRLARGGFLATNVESVDVDARCGQSPAQLVEDRLMRLLSEGSMSVSHLHMRGLLRGRG